MCVNLLIFLLYLAFASGKPSFTILLDTTQSMQEEIEVIKYNMPSLVNFLNNTIVDNYILVPFNDPVVGPPLISSTSEQFVNSINVSVSGGNDCPENCLAGIEKALEVSNPESYIFMFTDAYANDNSKFNEIANLCRRTRSQVIIFLSGRCFSSGSKQGGSIDIYYQIAKACSGNVFQFNPTNLRQAFRFIKELVQGGWSDVITHDSFSGYKEFTFSVDSATTDFLISVYGILPSLQITREGQEIRIEKIVDTRHSKVVRLTNPDNGEYKIKVSCQGPTSTTFYKNKGFPFQYGFSTKHPKSLKETSLRPIPVTRAFDLEKHHLVQWYDDGDHRWPSELLNNKYFTGWRNFILIVVPPSSNLILHALELYTNGDRKNISFEKVNESKGFYLADAFFEPQKPFKLLLSVQDTTKNQDIKVATKGLKPQHLEREPEWTHLFLEIIEPDSSTTIDYGENATIACKVVGYPKPTIWWEDDDGVILESEDFLLEIPNIHVSYVTMKKLSKNVTIYCKAKNARGEEAQNVKLFAKRTITFNVLQTPEDETFEYGTEGKLFCQVEAFPMASTKWYLNDNLIDTDERVAIDLEDNMLLIKNMTQDDVGDYKCVIENEIERRTFTAVVNVSGLVLPEIDIQNTELILKLGDWAQIECKIIKGTPTPEITWRYKSNDDDNFSNIPHGVYVDDRKIKLPVVRLEHRGLYRCEAVNVLGQDYKDVTVNVQSKPKIKNDHRESITVKEGDKVELMCEVNAVPKARVKWELTRDDLTVHLDNMHNTDFENTHRFEALWKDSGNYRCIAENDFGKAEKMVTVNVFVPPYIQTPASKTVTVNTGGSVTLACNVLFGNPVPSTKWEFIAPRSTLSVLNSRNTSSLYLTDISKSQEGTYMCLAENEVGNDIVRIHLKVRS